MKAASVLDENSAIIIMISQGLQSIFGFLYYTCVYRKIRYSLILCLVITLKMNNSAVQNRPYFMRGNSSFIDFQYIELGFFLLNQMIKTINNIAL